MCRTEFPTDDPDYENYKKHKVSKINCFHWPVLKAL